MFITININPSTSPLLLKKNFKKSLEKQKGIPCKKYKGMISRVKFELGTQKKGISIGNENLRGRGVV